MESPVPSILNNFHLKGSTVNENDVKRKIRGIIRTEERIALLKMKSARMREDILPFLDEGVEIDGRTAERIPPKMVCRLSRPLLLLVLEEDCGFTRFECRAIVRKAEAAHEKKAHVRITVNSSGSKKYRPAKERCEERRVA